MSRVVESKLPCPSCTSSDAYHTYDDGHGFCFSCKYLYHSNHSKRGDSLFTYEYLPRRGISKATQEFYGSKTRVDQDGKPIAVIYPYSDGKNKVRSLLEKSFKWEPAHGDTRNTGCFGIDLFTPGEHKYITITEGEDDALSIHQVVGGPAVSVQSSSTAGRDCSHDRSKLNAYERIYLAFDNDQPGRDAAAAVAGLFDPGKVFDVKFDLKDANDYLQAGQTQALKNIWWNSKKYLPEDIISSLDDFHKELDAKVEWGVPYPFKKLTEMTYGIRPGELVLVTAQEKVGKTEFMHTILHNLLKETDHAVGGLFTEETRRRTLQAIAGIELGRPVHLPDSGCTQVQVNEAVDKIVKSDDRLFLYTHTRNADPEVLLDRIRFLAAGRGCKHIMWDHPGMDVFGLGSDNERILLDTLATKAARLVK